MVYPVTLYYNTGFGDGNVPDSPSILQNATSRNFDAVWLLQDRDVAQIKLKANWDDVKNADYAKIGDSYYIVNGVNQLNGVAMLSLSMDPLATAGGIGAISVLDGWVKRASHKTNEFMSNTLPVEVHPTKPLVIDGPVQLTGDQSDTYTFIGATVDIEDATAVAKTYIDAADSSKSVTVPTIPQGVSETPFMLFLPASYAPDGASMPSSWGSVKTQKAPNMTLFSLYDADGNFIPSVLEGIQSLRGLGLEDVITTSYTIPFYYARPTLSLSSARVIQLGSVLHKVNPTSIPYRYGSYIPKNNRVYACQNQYTILSIASGEEKRFEAEELFSGGTEPDFYIFCDPSPEGKPYCQPTWYNGRTTMMFENSIGGSKWLTTPITLKYQSGWMDTFINNRYANQEDVIAARQQAATSLLGMASRIGNVAGLTEFISTPDIQSVDEYGLGLAGRAGGIANNFVNTSLSLANRERAAQRRNFQAMTQMKIVEPTIKFARSTEMQGYVGNGFMVYRTRLSDIDMEKLDNEFTYYGEPDNRRLEDNDLKSHQHFNYVDASNVTIVPAANHSIPLELRNRISSMFDGGIRIWHELPNKAAMTNNPLRV